VTTKGPSKLECGALQNECSTPQKKTNLIFPVIYAAPLSKFSKSVLKPNLTNIKYGWWVFII
jgi:hypothetical protein